MKKIVFIITVFIAATAFTVLDGPKDIVGKWKTAESSYPAARKVLIAKVKKISPEQAEQLEAAGDQLDQLIAIVTYEYKDNGEYEIVTPQGPQGGKWKIVENGKYIERQANAGGPARRDSIISIKQDKVVLMDLDTRENLEYVKAD